MLAAVVDMGEVIGMSEEIYAFPPGVAEELKYYVYRLIDPRSGETFYVGKGRGNRVFDHVLAKVAEEELTESLKRIRDIHSSGFEVAHVIHRHGLDEQTAFAVEAALIDAYPGLLNQIDGHDHEHGAMHVREIIRIYAAETAVFKHKAILISVNKGVLEHYSVYEAVRYAWKVDPEKARKADVVLATRQGLIIGAFAAKEWLPATTENFPGRESSDKRFGFKGTEASPEIQALYVGKQVPGEYRKPGAANPVKYTWH